jgi:hypothetical protein
VRFVIVIAGSTVRFVIIIVRSRRFRGRSLRSRSLWSWSLRSRGLRCR